MAKERLSNFRITRQGAQHWHPEQPGNPKSKLKPYGYGDEIALPYDAATDQKWNNLGLVLVGSAADPGEIKNTDAGTQPQSGNSPNNPGNEITGEGEGDEGATDEAEAAAKRKRLLNKLIKQVDGSHGASEFSDARKSVIEADLFEVDTVPTKKEEVLEALKDLLAAEEDDEE